MANKKRQRSRGRGRRRPKRRSERPPRSARTGVARDSSGEILGKQIIVYGERKEPFSHQRWAVPGGSLVTSDPAEVFRARVEPFSLDSIVNAAATITRIRDRDESGFVELLHEKGDNARNVPPVHHSSSRDPRDHRARTPRYGEAENHSRGVPKRGSGPHGYWRCSRPASR